MPFLNHVLASLSPAHIEALSPQLSGEHLPPGRTLYAPGDLAEAVYFPGDAVLSVVTVMQDGRSVEAATIGNESVAGVILALAGARAHARTFAQVGGSVMKLPVAAFNAVVAENPSLLRIMLASVQMDVAQSEQSVACNALHTAAQRLARWLLLTQDRVGSSTIPLTQEYLAIMLGVQRTTVTAVAQEFRASGLIAYSRGRIDIKDRPALEQASCECYAACQHDRQAPAAQLLTVA